MEQKEILEHLVAIRTLILDYVPPPKPGWEFDEKTTEGEINSWYSGYDIGFAASKTFAINTINKEINGVVGVDIIGMKTCNRKFSVSNRTGR